MPRKRGKNKSKVKPSLNVSEYISYNNPMFQRVKRRNDEKTGYGLRKYQYSSKIPPIHPEECLIFYGNYGEPGILFSHETVSKYKLKKIYSKNNSAKSNWW